MKNSAIGSSWEDFEKETFTPEEIAESNLRVEIMVALIKARNEKRITQKQLELLTGIKQPMIARIENGSTIPRVDTLQRLLAPLGMTIAIVPQNTNVASL